MLSIVCKIAFINPQQWIIISKKCVAYFCSWHLFENCAFAFQLTIEILHLDSQSVFDCNALPTSMNGIEHGVGCPGAVWMDGKPSKEYCVNDVRYPWWSNCCTWYAGHCLPKTEIPKTVIEMANRIDAEKYPMSFEKISYNVMSFKSGIVILCLLCITILVILVNMSYHILYCKEFQSFFPYKRSQHGGE